MAAIRIAQDNKVDGFDLLSVHNPLSFIAEVDFEGLAPNFIDVELLSDGASLIKMRAWSYKDVAPQTRQFIFVADEVIRGHMGSYEDVAQGVGTLIFMNDITKPFEVVFTYSNLTASTSFIACHAVSQFDDTYGASMNDVNQPTIYTCGVGGVVYLYCYNPDANNIISTTTDIQVAYAMNNNLDNFTNDNLDRFLIVV